MKLIRPHFKGLCIWELRDIHPLLTGDYGYLLILFEEAEANEIKQASTS